MNLSAVQATMARLREVAGPEGVQTHPEFGWFGFLDLPLFTLNTAVDSPVNQSLALSTTSWRPRTPRTRARTFPKSSRKHQDLASLEALVTHLAQRHGHRRVRQWLLQELRRC